MVKKMRRKAIGQGTGTIVMTLPIEWIRERGLKKGDYLEVSINNKDLIIGYEKTGQPKEEKLRLGKNLSPLKHDLVSAYCQGAERIKIMFDARETVDSQGNKIRAYKAVQDIVNNSLMNVQVEQSSDGSYLIEEITKSRAEDFAITLKKIFSQVSTISGSCLTAFQEKDKTKLHDVPYTFKTIERLCFYALRLLNKHHLPQYKTHNICTIIEIIREIANTVRHIAKHYTKEEKGIQAVALPDELIKITIEVFDNRDKIEQFHQTRDALLLKFGQAKIKRGLRENIFTIRELTGTLLRARLRMG